MKTKLPLEKGWCLRSLEPAASIDPAAVAAEDTGTWLSVDTVPAEVHDILLAHGKLDPEYRLGWCESAAWVTKLDWLYRLDFDCETPGVRTYLRFGGLDTFADIYLNGVLIGTHNDFYVSDLVDVTSTFAVHNTLLLHFHNALGVLDELEQPAEWEHLDKCKLLRKSRHDFPADITEGSTYQGIVGYHTPVGIYETVELILADAAEITCDEIRAALREDLVTGALRAVSYTHLDVYKRQGDVLVNVTVMLLITVGGIGFLVWDDISTHKFHWKRYDLHTKIVLSVSCIPVSYTHLS